MAAAGALTRVDRSAVHDILEHGSVRARETALQSLGAEDEPDEYLHAWAASELDRATELRRWRVAIAARDDGASLAAEYLVEVLEKRERMVERWVVTALSTEETRAALPLIARGAISGDSEVKAEALEAIESIADRTLARRLSALLESQNTEPDQYRLQALQDLTTDHQYWFRALAARTIFEELVQDLETASTTAASDDSPVVRSAIPDHETLLKSNGKLTRIDAILALRQATIFEHLDPEDLEALAEVSEERKYAAGDIIFEQGSPGDEMMMIVTGSAVVCTATSEGDRTIAEPGPGEPVGDLGVLRSRPRTAEVVAGPAGVHSLFISGEAFLELLEEQPGMAMALMAKMAERIALTVDPTGAGGTAPLAV
jgi:HEAT repeat protein